MSTRQGSQSDGNLVRYTILLGHCSEQVVVEEATSTPIEAGDLSDKPQKVALAVVVGLGIGPYLGDRRSMLGSGWSLGGNRLNHK